MNCAIFVGQPSTIILNKDTIKFVPEGSSTCDGSVFYQPIDPSDILKNYLYRQTEETIKIKQKYEEGPLSDLCKSEWIDDDDEHGYKPYGNGDNYSDTSNSFFG